MAGAALHPSLEASRSSKVRCISAARAWPWHMRHGPNMGAMPGSGASHGGGVGLGHVDEDGAARGTRAVSACSRVSACAASSATRADLVALLAGADDAIGHEPPVLHQAQRVVAALLHPGAQKIAAPGGEAGRSVQHLLPVHAAQIDHRIQRAAAMPRHALPAHVAVQQRQPELVRADR